jgi:hypothetical protein
MSPVATRADASGPRQGVERMEPLHIVGPAPEATMRDRRARRMRGKFAEVPGGVRVGEVGQRIATTPSAHAATSLQSRMQRPLPPRALPVVTAAG